MAVEVQVAIVGLVGTVLTILLGRQHKALGEVRKHSREANEQVSNSHTTNLRDDIDRLHDDVRAVLDISRQHAKEIGGLREDLRVEREERLAGDARCDEHSRIHRAA
jgi:hypothetical protein